ncbi:MAG: CDP-alcohol phosphatidyltransferase family protein [bacterium]|nr:CDP-alcohol phosphatidyltransferase family protein [bacterium]
MFGLKLKDIQWNIPNVLSMYRLCMFPIILVFIALKLETAFVVFFSINLITDIADGFIARRFNLQTKEGAILDSLADIGSYLSAIAGICVFHFYLFTEYGYWLSIFVVIYMLTMVVPQIRFGRPSTGLHLYSAKIAGYFQGVFLFILFTFKMVPAIFYAAMLIGYYSEIEGLIINLISKEPVLNAKTIFHYFKNSSTTRK